MSVVYLLDTNILAEPLRRNPDPNVMTQLQAHTTHLAVCAPVWHEIRYGWERLPRGGRREAVRRYLDEVVAPSLPVLPYDTAAAGWHARERARLESLGLTPPFVDGQIAAIARVNDLILVTRNTADYTHFEGLRAEDWARPATT